MSIYDDYSKTDYLEDVAFIAGSNFTFVFPIYDENNVVLDMTGSTLKWALSPYGQPEYKTLQKSGSLVTSSTFQVVLAPSDTASLGGVYIQQAEITTSGCTYRPAQGIVVIRKQIPMV